LIHGKAESFAEQFLVDDPATGFFHCHVAAACEFGEQG
jgi:hypothetical protein